MPVYHILRRVDPGRDDGDARAERKQGPTPFPAAAWGAFAARAALGDHRDALARSDAVGVEWQLRYLAFGIAVSAPVDVANAGDVVVAQGAEQHSTLVLRE